jgi:4-amino-4-deoxy-L-arabinose transferase-like glycosyltransferase
VPADGAPAWQARLVLAALLVVGAVLRLHHLATESLWLDEAFSITVARVSPEYIVEMTAQDVHPPFYYVLLYFWMALWGSTEWDARLLSVVVSLGTVVAAYLAGTRMFSRRVGLTAAGLLAIAPLQVEYAQEARMYALLALLATISSYCLFGIHARSTAGRGTATGPATSRLTGASWLAAYVVVTSLMTYTHVHSLFVLAAHALVVGIELWRRRGRALPFATRWAAAQIAVTLAYLPWLPTFARQVSHVQDGFWIPGPDWTAVPYALLVYAGSERLVWLMAPLAILGLWRAWRRPDSVAGPLLSAWLLCPLVLPFVLSLVGSSIFLPKYTIAASVPFALLVAGGVAIFPRAVRIVALAAVVVFTSQVLEPYYEGPRRKDDWRGAVRQIEARAKPGDLIVFYPFHTKIAYDMYETREDLVRVPFPRHAEAAPDGSVTAMLDRIVGDAGRVWLITMSFDSRQPRLVEALSARFAVVERVSAFHVDAHLFTSP